MAFKSSKGRNTGKELEVYRSTSSGQSVGGGGGEERNAFMATGGTILEPGDGFVYHRLPSTVGESSDVFEVVQLNSVSTRNSIKVMLGGAGGGGGGGGSSDSSSGTSGAGGSGGAVGAWTVPVTVGTYDQNLGSGGTSPFGPNGQGQSGPGGGGAGNNGNASWFRASGDPNRQLNAPGGIGGQPGGGPGNPSPPTPGSNVAISFTWSGGTLDDDLPSPSVGASSPNGGPSGGGPAPSDKWWKPFSSGGGSGGNGGGGRSNPNNQGGWRNPGNPAGNAGQIYIQYPKASTYQPGIPGFSEPS